MTNRNTKITERLQREGKPMDSKTRDQGDSIKKQDNNKHKPNERNVPRTIRKPIISDRGDVPSNKATKVQANKDKTNERSRTVNELKSKLMAYILPEGVTEVEKVLNIKASIINTAVNQIKVGEKKTISDKVRQRSKPNNRDLNNLSKDVKNSVMSDLKNDSVRNQPSYKSDSKEIISNLNKFDSKRTNHNVTKKERETPVNRKPMIKTVKSKNDNRVYKAVTFTEQKRVKPTVLEINIPNVQVKKTKAKLIDKNLEVKLSMQVTSNKSTNKLNVKENPQQTRRNRLHERTKRKKLNRCMSSPDKFKKVESPPTEVAKWGPSCINAHTRPYYEAWVNTTLAAISKISKKDKLYLEKQNIIKLFQKSLEDRVISPELVHEDYKNEFYTGRIKIKHKNLSKTNRQPQITPLLDKNL